MRTYRNINRHSRVAVTALPARRWEQNQSAERHSFLLRSVCVSGEGGCRHQQSFGSPFVFNNTKQLPDKTNADWMFRVRSLALDQVLGLYLYLRAYFGSSSFNPDSLTHMAP
jgi:hypothetical protein